MPYFQRGSSRKRSPPQSDMLNGGLARMKSKRLSFSSSLVGTAFIVPTDIGVDSANGKIHLAKPPSGVIAFLAINGDVAAPSTMIFYETLGLHEHAARTATRIVDPTLVGFQHFNQNTDHGARRVEFAAALAFRARKTTQEVFVHATDNVVGSIPCLTKLNT